MAGIYILLYFIPVTFALQVFFFKVNNKGRKVRTFVHWREQIINC